MRKATRAQKELPMCRPSCVFAVLMKQLHLGTEKKHRLLEKICSVFFLSVNLLRNAQVRQNPATLVPLSAGGGGGCGGAGETPGVPQAQRRGGLTETRPPRGPMTPSPTQPSRSESSPGLVAPVSSWIGGLTPRTEEDDSDGPRNIILSFTR